MPRRSPPTWGATRPPDRRSSRKTRRPWHSTSPAIIPRCKPSSCRTPRLSPSTSRVMSPRRRRISRLTRRASPRTSSPTRTPSCSSHSRRRVTAITFEPRRDERPGVPPDLHHGPPVVCRHGGRAGRPSVLSGRQHGEPPAIPLRQPGDPSGVPEGRTTGSIAQYHRFQHHRVARVSHAEHHIGRPVHRRQSLRATGVPRGQLGRGVSRRMS